MNVLIVDDDRFVVESLELGVHWTDLGFSNVYKAYNIQTAKELLNTCSIDLLLSDIDMPHGSGLDLLTWIRDKNSDLPVIFLTNYADFTYAQKAVELKSFHYFLKPIEFEKLTKIIQDATVTLAKQNVTQEALYHHFWFDFLHEKIASTPESLQQYLQQNKLPYQLNTLLLPVIFTLSAHYLSPDNTLLSYFSDNQHQTQYMKTSFKSIFSGLLSSGDVFMEFNMEYSWYLAIFVCQESTIPAEFFMECENYIATVNRQTKCSVNCFVGQPEVLSDFISSFSILKTMLQNCLSCTNQVVTMSQKIYFSESYPALDCSILEMYLENAQYDAFLSYCQQYLKKLSDSKSLYSISMNNFQIDVVQVLYAFLKRKNILAHKLFHDSSYHHLSNIARTSLTYMDMYIRYLIITAKNYLDFSSSEKSVAKSIQEYVDQHYAEEISRSNLSDILYLDSDYASRLFKKEMGISFGNYLIQKRIETAKNLLLTTVLPVNTVADNVGYGNYSYFIRLFKKTTGMTPIEFRNSYSD
ncbi:MAG TPA: response regulator [Candidatus Pelethocola excrementipullorum]|nr:response regulator [Candidatus Pelethocola excrementipullorum]